MFQSPFSLLKQYTHSLSTSTTHGTLLPQQTAPKGVRAPRQDLSGYSAEERVQRRKTRARVYSHNARQRNKVLLHEIRHDIAALAVFRDLVEKAPHIMLVLSMDLQATILYANDALNDTLHLSSPAILGRYVHAWHLFEKNKCKGRRSDLHTPFPYHMLLLFCTQTYQIVLGPGAPRGPGASARPGGRADPDAAT